MITAADFVCLPYTPDLTKAGIGLACRSLLRPHDRIGASAFDGLRGTVTGISVELAFRRYLAAQNIPFNVKAVTPFTEPDHYDVTLGGHRCDIKSFLISDRAQIMAVHTEPGQILHLPGMVSLDQYSDESGLSGDLYLFAFLTGLIAVSPEDLRKVGSSGMPTYLIHALPAAWAQPDSWIPLGPLALKSESAEAIIVEIGGQDAAREFRVSVMELPPRQRVQIDAGLHSLAYVHVNTKPSARIGVFSPSRRETYLIQPTQWRNIWIYGMRIYLAGWITREDFRQRANLLPEGSRPLQFDRTRGKNLAVPISELHPLSELLSRVRAWMSARDFASG